MVDVLVKPSVFWWVHLIELVKNSPHSFICQVVDYFLQNTKAFLWRWGGLPFPEKRGKEHTNRDRHDWLLKHQNIKNCIPLHITSTGYMSTSATFRWKPSPWDVKQTKVQISGLLNLSKQLTVSKWYCMIATRKKKYLNSDKRTRLNYPIPMNSVSNSKRSLRSNKQTQGIEPLQITNNKYTLCFDLYTFHARVYPFCQFTWFIHFSSRLWNNLIQPFITNGSRLSGASGTY